MPNRKQTPPTKEEIEEIKKENKRRLDEILSQGPMYIKTLGQKYYGDRWHTILDKNHYMKKEHNKRVQQKGTTFVPYIQRKIFQYDLDGNFIREWNNALEWAESEGRSRSAAGHVSKPATGLMMSQKESAYGYKWKFDYDLED
jgi:hypothetical protein